MTKRANLNLHFDRAPPAEEYEPLVRLAAGGDRQAMERLLMRAQEVKTRLHRARVMLRAGLGDV